MRRIVFFAVMMCGLASGVISPVAAQADEISTAQDGKTKINLSGRQRMLSQRMAKAACFAAIGVKSEYHLQEARDAHRLFGATLHRLRHGDANLGMRVETTPRILMELDGVEELWRAYGTYVNRAAQDSDAADEMLSLIAALNLPVLRQMNRAVGAFEGHYGGSGEMHPALALTLNVAGRQRMLSQKAAKEFCMLLAVQDITMHRTALTKTIALFDSSLRALQEGNEALGLPPAPNDEIAAQLDRVDALWIPLRSVFEGMIAGDRPSAADIERVARDNIPLLKEMNEAVSMYAAL